MNILAIVNLWPPFEEGIAGIAAVGGPYSVAAIDVFVPGAVEASCYVAGAQAAEVFVPGAVEAQGE